MREEAGSALRNTFKGCKRELARHVWWISDPGHLSSVGKEIKQGDHGRGRSTGRR